MAPVALTMVWLKDFQPCPLAAIPALESIVEQNESRLGEGVGIIMVTKGTLKGELFNLL